jgi:hypothetical protein
VLDFETKLATLFRALRISAKREIALLDTSLVWNHYPRRRLLHWQWLDLGDCHSDRFRFGGKRRLEQWF